MSSDDPMSKLDHKLIEVVEREGTTAEALRDHLISSDGPVSWAGLAAIAMTYGLAHTVRVVGGVQWLDFGPVSIGKRHGIFSSSDAKVLIVNADALDTLREHGLIRH